jgi:Cdc6-like AAA superfamily ATPase
MSKDNVVSLKERAFDKYVKLIEEYKPKKVLVIILDEYDQVQYIAPEDTSIYEIAGWLETAKFDVLNDS